MVLLPVELARQAVSKGHCKVCLFPQRVVLAFSLSTEYVSLHPLTAICTPGK